MKKKPKLRHLLFYSFGLGGLIGAVALQTMAFWDITTKGYFFAIEPNPAILAFELFLTAFTVVYLVYIIYNFDRVLAERQRP